MPNSGSGYGTNFSTGNSGVVGYQITGGDGLAIFANCTGVPPTTANVFAIGCLMVRTDGSGKSVYENVGTSASPSWSLLDTASSPLTLPASATDSTSTTTTSLDLTMSALTTGAGLQITAASATSGPVINVVTPSSKAIAVGRVAATPAFQVDASTASQVAGLKVTGAATGGTVALAAIDSGTDTSLSINGKGAGLTVIGNVSTGLVVVGRGPAKQLIQGGTITALGTTQNSTPTAAQLLGGIVTQTSATGAGTVTLPDGTTMSSAVNSVQTGDSFRVRFANLGGGFTLTITGTTGMTVIGTATVASATNIDLLFVNTGTNTWNCYTNK